MLPENAVEMNLTDFTCGTADVLLVEDNQLDIELMLHEFRTHCFRNPIHTVCDGEEALDYVFCRGKYDGRDPGRQPRIILLDRGLPKIDGLEVLCQIKDDRSTYRIPVIVLTTWDSDLSKRRDDKLGVYAYLRKPLQFSEFLEATRELGCEWEIGEPSASTCRSE